MKSEKSLFLGFRANKGILPIAFLLFLCSCGSRKSVKYPYNGPINIKENTKVELSTPVVVSDGVAPVTWKDTIQARLDSLCQLPLFETTQLGLYVFDLTEKQPLYALNAAQRMRPASIEKLITSISCLHYLGGDYNFKTDIRVKGTLQTEHCRAMCTLWEVWILCCRPPI